MQLTQFVDETEGFSVRAVHRDEQQWFIAPDVCDALGIKNSRQAVSKLDEDERNTVTLNDGIRGNPNVTAVNESGLYALILRSNKPKARAFRKWVTSEVLPSIRKTGGYSVGGDPVEITKMEIDRLTQQITNVGVPEPQAEKAAKAAFRAKLAVMRAAIMGIGPARLTHHNGTNGAFASQYGQDCILEALTEPMMPSRLCERVMAETGMSRSTFWRLMAPLRAQGRIRDRANSSCVERVWEEGGAQ
jgi:prophage antirepressor-like protein